jgi:hypothetical protein
MKCFYSGLTKFLQNTPINTALCHLGIENEIPVDYALYLPIAFFLVLITVFRLQKIGQLGRICLVSAFSDNCLQLLLWYTFITSIPIASKLP